MRAAATRPAVLHCSSLRLLLAPAVLVGLLTALPLLAAKPAPRPVAQTAEGRILTGVVLRIDGAEFVIDLGLSAGLAQGMQVTLYRTVKVRHPVTGKDLLDRFAVGQTEAIEVVESMAILQPEADVAKLLRVGDRVQVALPAAEPKPALPADAKQPPREEVAAKACQPCPVCPPAHAQPGSPPPPQDVLVADRVFRACLGRQPSERIGLWQDYLAQFPSSSVRNAVLAEIDALAEWMRAGQQARRIEREDREAQTAANAIYHEELEELRQGEPAWLVFAAADWQRVTDLRVHLRRTGESSYELMRPEPSGALQRRLKLPSAWVKSPGFQYFVAITRVNGVTTTLAGQAERPTTVKVARPLGEQAANPDSGSSFRLLGEYVDFNRGRRDDEVGLGMADLTYRLGGGGGLYSFQMGYGVLAGSGGRVAERDDTLTVHTSGYSKGKTVAKDDTLESRSSAFKYSYLGAEWALHRLFHATTRLVVGLDDQGLDSGVEVAGRIGAESGTNLLIGGSSLAGMGRAGFVALTARVLENVPMTGILEVTNRPVREDIAIRLIYEAGWRASEHFELTGRLGYNLRTIVHAGVSVGGGVAFHW